MSKHRKSKKEHAQSMGGILAKIVKEASPIVQFVQQITEKDLAYINSQLPAGTQIDTMDQLKNMVNIISAKMTGFNPFKNNYQAVFKLNPAGALNKWTIIDAILIGYGQAGKHAKWLPKAAYLGSIGKKSIIPAIAAGVLDTPTTTPSGNKVNFNKIPALGSNQQGMIISPQGIRSSGNTAYTMELR